MAVAFDQAGYFTAAQAREVGYTYQAQKYHVDHGNWLRVDRGLFRLPEWPSRPEDAYVRWALWSRGRGVLSHDTALVIHDLSDVNPGAIHLTVDRSFTARDDAVVLHVGVVPDGDAERHGAWAVTTPERTLVDTAGSGLAQEHIDRAVADALTRGLITRRRLLRLSDAAPDRAALRLERALAAASVEQT